MGFGGFQDPAVQSAFMSNTTREQGEAFLEGLSILAPTAIGGVQRERLPGQTPEQAQAGADRFFELRPDQKGKLPSGKPIAKATATTKKEGDPAQPLTEANRNVNLESRSGSGGARGSVSQLEKRSPGTNGSSVTALGSSLFKKTLLGE